MGWERRKYGGTYYCRSHRVAGRVVRGYVATGPLAELSAAVDEEARAKQTAARQRLLAERQRAHAVSAAVAGVADLAEALARVVLVAVGYRRHDRGRGDRLHPGRGLPVDVHVPYRDAKRRRRDGRKERPTP